MLFHWSPTARRKQIERYGLKPGSLDVDRQWRPPYVCFSASPSLAFSLCQHRDQIESWDLWMVWSDRIDSTVEASFDDRDDTVKEYRVYERIFKRDVWYVATRDAR